MPSVPIDASEPAETPRSKTCSTDAAGQTASSAMPSPTSAWVYCRGTAASTPSAAGQVGRQLRAHPAVHPGAGLQDQVAAELLVEGVADRPLAGGREHGDPADQGHADHQRGRSGSGTPRVAHGVLPGQLPAGAGELGQHESEDAHHRAGQHRAEGRDADEPGERAQQDHRHRAAGDAAEHRRDAARDQDHAERDPPLRRPGALGRDRAHGLDRRDPGSAAGRQQGRADGDRDAERERDEQGRRADHQRALGHGHPEAAPEGTDALGHADAGEQAEQRTRPRPTTAASIATLRRTCFVLAPMARSRASSLGALRHQDREGVVDDERADEQGDSGEDPHEDAEEVDVLVAAAAVLLLEHGAGDHVEVATERAADGAGELGLAHAGRGVHRDAVDGAVPAEQPLGRVEREQHGAVAGPVVGVAEARHADHGHVGRSGDGQHGHLVARRQVGLVGQGPVDDDLVARAWPAAGRRG